MALVRRILLLVTAIVGLLAWIWISAVRAVPGVRSRKAQARAERATRRGPQAGA